MSHTSLLIAPSADFWRDTVRRLLDEHPDFVAVQRAGMADFSACRVIVPAFSHAQLFTAALERALQKTFIPPRINTLSGLLALQGSEQEPAGFTERFMQLYAALREHDWLKQMFAARSNTDLLPLAHTLLSLSDELTQALLPSVAQDRSVVDAQWEAALAQLTPQARDLLSDEAKLVWTIWQSQLDSQDPHVIRFTQLLAGAEEEDAPLIWISPVAPEPIEQAFLEACRQHVSVWSVSIDWREAAVPAVYRAAWPEVMVPDTSAPALWQMAPTLTEADTPSWQLCPANSLDDAATKGAQTVVQWLLQGKTAIAVVAQDRVMARRLRALLERAEVYVADETGWMLSTTSAATAIAAWFTLIMSGAQTSALLGFLKLPFFTWPDKAVLVMQIESTLRRRNINGEWRNILWCFKEDTPEYALLSVLQQQAERFAQEKNLTQWSQVTHGMLAACNMQAALASDAAGKQVLALLNEIEEQSEGMSATFQLGEWFAFVNMQLDSTAFIPEIIDRRVVMLPLNGARLRPFDAVLVMGADAHNLPSRPKETLFFSNAVRRELGLATRAQRHQQQLRDVVELVCTNREVVFCWQAHKNDEPNPVSPWIERLQLVLEKSHLPLLGVLTPELPNYRLEAMPVSMPAPSAAVLHPNKLSPSALNTLVACPYQFFAKYMLRVVALDELSDTPEKRDYGNWLHDILHQYHTQVLAEKTPLDDRAGLLATISNRVFEKEMRQYPAALAYYVRWQKVMPAYLVWANAREAAGWQFSSSELLKEKMLTWDEGEIVLHGRLDRMDENEQGELAVLDYKTRSADKLNKKMAEQEDYQLAFYGLLFDAPLAAAHYVALELHKDAIDDVYMAGEDFEQKQYSVQQLITTTMSAIAQGAPMVANGAESVCQYCDVKGLCRKGGWQ